MIHVYFFIWRRPFQHFPNTNDPSWHIVIGRSEIFRRRQSCSGSWRNRRNGWSQGDAGSGYRRTIKLISSWYQDSPGFHWFPWGLDYIVSVVHIIHAFSLTMFDVSCRGAPFSLNAADANTSWNLGIRSVGEEIPTISQLQYVSQWVPIYWIYMESIGSLFQWSVIWVCPEGVSQI